jgi:predicted LPLAT superfamily acyltransferase
LVNKQKRWRGKTGGGSFGQGALYYYFKHGNVCLIYAIMGIVVLFYLVAHGNETVNIYRYFRKRHRYGRVKSVVSVYLNHYLFGKTIIDKFVLFAGRKKEYSIDPENIELFDEVAGDPSKGAILVHAHVGCSEIIGYILSQPYKIIHALVFGGEAIKMQQYRQTILSEQNVRMIPVVDGFSHIFDVINALKNNELISVSADRVYDGSKNMTVNFLGGKASFPVNPFHLAAKMKIPVLAFFVMQTGYKKYKCHVVRVSNEDWNTLPTSRQATKLTENFVSELEKIIKRYPLQWYNFHSFWEN